MPKIRTQLPCPNCRQPIQAEVEQLFDVAADPQAKQRFLSGGFNVTRCPHCGYQGALSTPLVYHDPAKDLLLTHMPPELNLPRNEQERVIGAMINKVVENLPPEQRKGYLFNPQATLTLQGMVERVLEGEGVTREMLDAQQKRLGLIQRLASLTSEDALAEVAKEEDANINAEFFALLARLAEASLAQNDQNSARALSDLQRRLLPVTTYGKQVLAQTQELEAAIKDLQDAGEGLTREKLLELVIAAPTDTRVRAFVSLARGGMDYEFFQLLTERIDAAKGAEKDKLTKLREQLLEATREVDQQMEARMAVARQNVNTLLSVENIRESILQNLPAVDDFFVQAVNLELEAANQKKDEARIAKLKQVVDVLSEIQQAAAGPDMAVLEELLDAPDDETLKKSLEAHREKITPEFLEALTSLMVQFQSGEDKETAEKVRKVYRAALRVSMQAGMGASK